LCIHFCSFIPLSLSLSLTLSLSLSHTHHTPFALLLRWIYHSLSFSPNLCCTCISRQHSHPIHIICFTRILFYFFSNPPIPLFFSL
jgi:hypothetical protein